MRHVDTHLMLMGADCNVSAFCFCLLKIGLCLFVYRDQVSGRIHIVIQSDNKTKVKLCCSSCKPDVLKLVLTSTIQLQNPYMILNEGNGFHLHLFTSIKLWLSFKTTLDTYTRISGCQISEISSRKWKLQCRFVIIGPSQLRKFMN